MNTAKQMETKEYWLDIIHEHWLDPMHEWKADSIDELATECQRMRKFAR